MADEAIPVSPSDLAILCITLARFAAWPPDRDSPYGQRLYRRLRNPEPGDIVVETSSFRPYDPESVGVFVGRVWDMGHPDGEKQDPINYLWRVKSLITGEVQNWGNADFVAVPTPLLCRAVEQEVLTASSPCNPRTAPP